MTNISETTPAIAEQGTAKSKRRKREHTRYEEWQREMVRREYEGCTTLEAKLDLCRRANIKDIRRLYNLAHQEGKTRRSGVFNDAEFRAWTNGDTRVLALKELYTKEEELEILATRDDPATTTVDEIDERFIVANYGKMDVVAIAKNRGMSETAVMYYARKLKRIETDASGTEIEKPLRRPALGYTLRRVSAWLGLSEEELRLLTKGSVRIRPLRFRTGEVEEHWVFANSLAPWLAKHGERLIALRGADRFFVMDVLESAEDLKAMRTTPTGCLYADHGHRCVNPWAGPRHETFCPDGIDPLCKAKEVRH